MQFISQHFSHQSHAHAQRVGATEHHTTNCWDAIREDLLNHALYNKYIQNNDNMNTIGHKVTLQICKTVQ